MRTIHSATSSDKNKPYAPQASQMADCFVTDSSKKTLFSGLKPIQISHSEQEESSDKQHDFLNSVLTPEQLLQHQLGKADQRNTHAYIKMDSQLVAVLHTDGSVSCHDHLHLEGVNHNEHIEFLQQHYGTKASIEYFEAGKGPCHAEAYHALYQRDYRQDANDQYKKDARARFETLQAQMQAHKAQQAWENTPQTQMLSLEDQSICSWDQEGAISINYNSLQQQAEACSYQQDYTREIYRQLRDSQSPEQALEVLQQHFADEAKLTILAQGETLTRRDALYYSEQIAG